MKKFAQRVKSAFMDESGQGATEYILLLVVVVALVIMFKGKIRAAISEKLDELEGNIQSFKGDN
jgi:Flp pilus assembly pilin Flp